MRFTPYSVMLATGAVLACGGGPVTPVTVTGYTVTNVGSPVPSIASAGTSLHVAFLITENESDGSSRAASGKALTVTVIAGAGTVAGATSTTLTSDADGLVSTTWVLGPTIGTQALRGLMATGASLDVMVTATALPTLLVTNASCTNGGCRTLEIRAFVSKFTVPGQLPTGMGFIGFVPPGQTCLAFPPAWTLTITGPSAVTVITWTPRDSSEIYVVAVDSALYHGGPTSQAQIDSMNHGTFPYDGMWQATLGRTDGFVAGSAPGWTISFPSMPITGTRFTQGAPCQH